MAARNIDKMHYLHGFGNGFCHECPHFRKECWNKKCEKHIVGYDNDGQEIVRYDSFIACGLINKPYPDDSGPIPGQISMDIKAVY